MESQKHLNFNLEMAGVGQAIDGFQNALLGNNSKDMVNSLPIKPSSVALSKKYEKANMLTFLTCAVKKFAELQAM